ncbi:MAG: glycosyltransferase, partial [Ilumatobacteraceae bacterium]
TNAWLLTNAAALAYPSLDEGFGFPLLEAMAAGTPVVATSVGSIPEVAGDAAILCAPDDVAGLADALHRVLTDADERERLLAAGRRRLQAFDWEATALAMSALYRDLAGERAVAR